MSTIAAISTAPGVGGIGIIRLSGEETFNIIEKIFVPKNKSKEIKGYTFKYGNIINPKTNEILDEVLVSYFIKPRSYTMENMCEINSHGGNIVMQNILEVCLENGAELAEPGEFTKRAFLNGRIDLSQAESIIDIINSKTKKESKASLKQLEGFLSKKIKSIRKKIMDVMVDIEANIDYPEYDIEEVTEKKVENMLKSIEKELMSLKNTFDNGKIIKDGINVAIVGKPNAGKSSLLNFLVGEDRAIVTEIAGTTRDILEEYISLNGITLRVIDTAGIRETEDVVEKIGVGKAKQMAENADLILYVVDSSLPLDDNDREIMELLSGRKSIVIYNKTDLEAAVDIEELKEKTGSPVIPVSVVEETGISQLEDEIKRMFFHGELSFNDEVYITNARHKAALEESKESLKLVMDSIAMGMSEDFFSIDLMNAYESLGRIVGESVGEDLVNEIFSKFCVGK